MQATFKMASASTWLFGLVDTLVVVVVVVVVLFAPFFYCSSLCDTY